MDRTHDKDEKQYRFELYLDGIAFTLANITLKPLELTRDDIKKHEPQLNDVEINYVLARTIYSAMASGDPSYREPAPVAPSYTEGHCKNG